MRISRAEARVFKLAVYSDKEDTRQFFTTVEDIHNKQECTDCAIYDLSLDEIMKECYCSTFQFLLWHPNPGQVENLDLVDLLNKDNPLPGALCDIFDKNDFNYELEDYDGFDLELNY